MTQVEPSEEAITFLDILAFIGNPVIEGLTIVAAGYFLFRMERRARRKEIAHLVEVLLSKAVALLNAAVLEKSEPAAISITMMLQLRPALEEFSRISDKIGILGKELVDPIHRFFFQIQLDLTQMESHVPAVSPHSMYLDRDLDSQAFDFEAAEFLVTMPGSYEILADATKELSPLISKITGSDQDELIVDVKRWAPKIAELKQLLADYKEEEPPTFD